MTSGRFKPPDASELEVSVFGPGKGECIVLGLPSGPWLIVDSFVVKSASGRSPVAVEYLDRLGVSDVAGVFITHWHDDHTRGAAEVLRHFAPSLKYVGLPSGFAEELLASFIVDLLPHTHRFKLVADLTQVISALKTDPALKDVRATTLADLSAFAFSTERVLYALSPSLADQQHQAAQLATYLPGWTGPKPRRFDVNSGCAVLKLSCGPIRVLLGSDLDVGDSDTRGWQRIARMQGADLAAHIFKVGHHGSETAFHLPALTAMKSTDAHGAITPFPARGEHLPREKMLKTYRPMFRSLNLTARKSTNSKAGKVPLKNTPFSAYAKSTAGTLEAVGHIRFRVDVTTASIRTELFGGAARA